MNECMEWRGYTNGRGYPQKTINGRKVLLHRYSWEWANGPIPDNMCICHSCDNPPCINPDHLFLGTQADNMRDMYAKGRDRGRRKTHCKHGHPLFGENLYVKPSNGARQCRTCQRHSSTKYRQKLACVEALND